MKKLATFLWIMFCASSAAAQVIELNDPTLPRGIDSMTSFTIEVTIDDIPDANFQDAYNHAQNVSIRIREVDAQRDLANTDVAEEDTNNFGIVVDTRQVTDSGVNDAGKNYVVVEVTVAEQGTEIKDILKPVDGVNTLGIKAFYTAPDQEDYFNDEFITFSESVKVVNAAPSDFSLTGAFKALKFGWNASETVSFKTGSGESDTSTGSPTHVVIAVFDENAHLTNLPTYTFSPDADADVAGELCHIDYSKVDTEESCVVCEDGDIYLNYSSISSNLADKISIARLSNKSGSGTINVNEGEKTYAAFMYYQPDGLQRTLCKTATSTVNSTWAEANGEPVANAGDPKCFIATAAYGSVLDKKIDTLRWFRDEVLMNSQIGSEFVALYYTVAPLFVPVVQQNTVVNNLTKLALYPLVTFIELGQQFGFMWLFVFAALIVGISIGSIHIVRQRIKGYI